MVERRPGGCQSRIGRAGLLDARHVGAATEAEAGVHVALAHPEGGEVDGEDHCLGAGLDGQLHHGSVESPVLECVQLEPPAKSGDAGEVGKAARGERGVAVAHTRGRSGTRDHHAAVGFDVALEAHRSHHEWHGIGGSDDRGGEVHLSGAGQHARSHLDVVPGCGIPLEGHASAGTPVDVALKPDGLHQAKGEAVVLNGAQVWHGKSIARPRALRSAGAASYHGAALCPARHDSWDAGRRHGP
ncbi:unannotated protein [freshwater metagenome]|uniref:Unannotated protein n=1 Tax=freshwater metagenome TaxID=449393 RepID=A0A6J7PHA5_9ZZZZ